MKRWIGAVLIMMALVVTGCRDTQSTKAEDTLAETVSAAGETKEGGQAGTEEGESGKEAPGSQAEAAEKAEGKAQAETSGKETEEFLTRETEKMKEDFLVAYGEDTAGTQSGATGDDKEGTQPGTPAKDTASSQPGASENVTESQTVTPGKDTTSTQPGASGNTTESQTGMPGKDTTSSQPGASGNTTESQAGTTGSATESQEPPQASQNSCTSHQFVTESVTASCESGGGTRTICSICGLVESQSSTGAASGHDWQKSYWPSAPTCEHSGYYNMVCSRCGAVGTDGTDPPLPHTPVSREISHGTCNTLTIIETSCSVCGLSLGKDGYYEEEHDWIAVETDVFDEGALEWQKITITQCARCKKLQ